MQFSALSLHKPTAAVIHMVLEQVFGVKFLSPFSRDLKFIPGEESSASSTIYKWQKLALRSLRCSF